MGYSAALEAAGCKVLAFNEFGSYQGVWLAFVEYKNEFGIVEGSYGSCSGCDAFQAEFDHGEEYLQEDGKYYKGWYANPDYEITEEEYNEGVKAEHQRLVDFGFRYVRNGLYDQAHYEHRISLLEESEWFDIETKEICDWALSRFKTISDENY